MEQPLALFRLNGIIKAKGVISMKKIIITVLIIAVCFTLCSCGKETGTGVDAGGANMDSEAGMYSIAVYPHYESEENVADAQIVTLSETEAYSFETLGEALPTELPEGYSYQSGYLYDTTMEDGTKYYLLRVTFADGPVPEEIVTEDGGVVMPAEFPSEIVVTVTNYEPVENVELYVSEDFGNIDINDIWFSNDENVCCAVEAYDLSDDEIVIVLESMY